MKLKLKTNQPDGVMRLSETPAGCLCVVVEGSINTKVGEIIIRPRCTCVTFAVSLLDYTYWGGKAASCNPLVRILEPGELLEVSE